MLLVNHDEFFFYSGDGDAEPPETKEPDPAPAGSGFLAWFSRRLVNFRRAWNSAEGGLAGWSRRAWDRLHSLCHADEAMLVRLRKARRIDLHHPASRDAATVLEIWRSYLARRWRRHLAYFSFNAAIAPLTLILAVLPGPNLIGYWFTYRAIHHLLILLGIQRVLGGSIPTRLHPLRSLDLPVHRDADGKATHEAIEGDGAGLNAFLGNAPRGTSGERTQPIGRVGPHDLAAFSPNPVRPGDPTREP